MFSWLWELCCENKMGWDGMGWDEMGWDEIDMTVYMFVVGGG